MTITWKLFHLLEWIKLASCLAKGVMWNSTGNSVYCYSIFSEINSKTLSAWNRAKALTFGAYQTDSSFFSLAWFYFLTKCYDWYIGDTPCSRYLDVSRTITLQSKWSLKIGLPFWLARHSGKFLDFLWKLNFVLEKSNTHF